MLKSFAYLLLMLAGTLAVEAQTSAQEAFRLAGAALEASPANYKAPLDSLRKIQTLADDPMGQSLYSQAMATYQSFVSNYDSALYYYDNSFPRPGAPRKHPGMDSAFVQDAYFRNALNALPRKLMEQQVVMLNEAHHVPAHRAFAINLLDVLYRQGFRHIAMETLAASDTAQLGKRGYPIHESGYYQKEPLFGEFMRQALLKGFSLLAYESEVPCKPEAGKGDAYCSNLRDSIQAQNLAGWVQQNPGKKLFVYAGYDHILESTDNAWVRMAQYFNKMTGINPYTIDQVRMNERSVPQMEDLRYRAAADLKNIQAPMVAYVEDTLWSHSGQVDATVFHPRYLNKAGSLPHYQLKHKRPDFYMLHNKRKPILISSNPKKSRFSSELLPKSTALIQVFYQKEEGNRIPADVVELKKDQEEAILYLYPGAYDIVYLNNDGKILMTRPMTIN